MPSPTKSSLQLLRHEYGHVLQDQIVGHYSYYSVIGKESLLSASIPNGWGHSHSTFWTETWANHLSNNYFHHPSNWADWLPIKNISTFNKERLLLGNPFIKFGRFWWE